MNILIDNFSMEPIYEQIVNQIKNMILRKELNENDQLPSVRGLSKELKISALTVKKAYDSLEKTGFIITVHGKGSYISNARTELIVEEQKHAIEVEMERIVEKAYYYGMTKQEIKELIEIILED